MWRRRRMHYVGDDEGVIYPLPTFKVKFLHLESISAFIIAFTSVKKDIPRAVNLQFRNVLFPILHYIFNT